MKFLLPVALLAVAVAAGSDCEAENIVDACLKSTEGQMSNCDGADYDCLCSAQQSIATYVTLLLCPLFPRTRFPTPSSI